MSHTLTLALADLDTITAGGTITMALPDVTFELTDEDNYVGPAFSDGVCRIGLDWHLLRDLRRRIPRKVFAVGVNESVAFTTDEIVAAGR